MTTMYNKAVYVDVKAHPEYEAKKEYYNDCYYLISLGDAKTVKAGKTDYLPKLMSQIKNNSTQGTIEYDEYLNGAVWSDIPRESRDRILGEMFAKPSKYNLPKVMEQYNSDITKDGNGLNILEAEVTIWQLEYSRIGAMIYVVTDITGKTLPRVALYNALDFFDWHQFTYKDGSIRYDFVKLRTQDFVFNPDKGEYTQETKYIIHAISPENKYYKVTIKAEDYDKYSKTYQLRRAYGKKNGTYIEPVFKGFNLDFVPFVAINASNVDGSVETPVLFSQVDLSLHAYRVSALYNKKLRQQTWALLVASGFGKDLIDNAVKADGVLPGNQNSKAEYITPDSTSLEALKNAWNEAEERAKAKGIQISEKAEVESGIALEKRIENQSNAYRRMAIVRNEGILKILGYISEWGSLGQKVENEWITPFLDFNVSRATVEEYTKMALSWKSGSLSNEDFYSWCKKHEYTSASDVNMFVADLDKSNYQD